jgi:hypothetical protein
VNSCCIRLIQHEKRFLLKVLDIIIALRYNNSIRFLRTLKPLRRQRRHREKEVSKLNAIRLLPTEEKLRMSRALDTWIQDYDSGHRDRDPEAWFVSRQAKIRDDLVYIGFPREELENIGVAAAHYYMSF